MTCSPGSLSQLAVHPGTGTQTFGATSERWDFLYSTLAKQQKVLMQRGMSGTRSNMVERAKLAPYSVDGRLAFDMSPLVLDKWLPRILGAAENANSFALAETLPAFCVLLDAVGAVYQFNDCYVNRGIFRAKSGPEDDACLVELIAEIQGKSEVLGVSWPGAIPAVSTAANSIPFIFHEGILKVTTPSTLTAYPIHDFVLAIDNSLERRWVNSITATEICPQDRTVVLRTNNPFTATEYAAFYNNSSAITGLAATLVFTNGALVTTFTMPALTWADNGPTIPGKQEIKLSLDFFALKKTTSAELVVTNVS